MSLLANEIISTPVSAEHHDVWLQKHNLSRGKKTGFEPEAYLQSESLAAFLS